MTGTASPSVAFGRWLHSVRPDRKTLVPEALAGLPGAIGSVPDGMAAAVLAGVNPIYGLYASMVGPVVGGLFASTALVVVTTTSAAALAAGSTLSSIAPADRPEALFLLTLMAGTLMLLAGIFRFGRYIRFVANSVMLGFITGVATNVALGQIPALTGAEAVGRNAVAKALNVLLHPGSTQLATLLLGLSALAIMVVASRTRYQPVAALVALLIPSVIAVLAGLEKVATVSDSGTIPTGLPIPALPSLSAFTPNLLVGAAAVAIIVLVQGSGVAESAPNPDGSRSDPNRDFVAEGLANVTSGLFSGQPVGASVSQTALNISAGGRSRWAPIFSGLWMGVILLLLSGLVGQVAMTTLAAVLIYAAVRAIKPRHIELVWRTGMSSRIAMTTTFVATLFLPVAAAVGIGVALSLLLQINREALDLTVVGLTLRDDGSIVVGPAPTTLENRTVVVLDVYGSLLFAGARTLEARLPDPTGADRPAVVLRLRGRTTLESTAIEVLSRYAAKLDAVGGRLFLSGIDPKLATRLRHRGTMDALGPLELVTATEVLGASSREAYERALAFVAEREPTGSDDA
jgi:sulfate permease, SulP family